MQYQALLEPFLVAHLTASLPSFALSSLPALIADRQSRPQSSEEYNEVIDVLVALTDFESFLRLMMDKREELDDDDDDAAAKGPFAAAGAGSRALDGFGLVVTPLRSARR